jgi:two-component system, chemotaxis family, chemotaxis protein CheY
MSQDAATADSTPPNPGEPKRAVFGAKRALKTYDLSQVNALLAEDSPPMQALMSQMLKAFGIGEVMAAGSGTEAQGLISVTLSRKRSGAVKGIDVVLTDLIMPDGSGIELIQWIRAHKDDAVRFLPVILISAHTTSKVVSQARDCGANEALVKPVSGGKLASRILSLIDRPRPFIKAPGFFGPDRRRQALPYPGAERRVKPAEEIQVHHEQI